VDVDVERLHVAEHVLVPVELEVRVMAALEEDLDAAQGLGLLDLLPHRLLREGTEPAGDGSRTCST
jgi:hypothetical protein